MKHYYIDHLYNTLFSSTKKLTLEELYCDECGDYDEYLGDFETEEEAEFAYKRRFEIAMSKDEILKNIENVKTVKARNRMGCDENWYNTFYALQQTFEKSELEAMSEDELNHLIRLGDAISENLY